MTRPELSTMRRRLIRLAHAGGLVIVVLSLVFLANRLIQTGVWDLAKAHGPALLAGIVAAAAGYGAASFLLSVAWVRIIRWCGQGDVPWTVGIALYGRTQIAKYLPGNVFHFVGRHVAGRRLGFDHIAMVWAALSEAAGLVSVAAALGMIGALFWLPLGAGPSSAVMIVLAVLALMSPFVLSRGFLWMGSVLNVPVQRRGAMDIVTGLQPTYLLYVLFFVISAVILWCLSVIITGVPDLSILPVLIPVLAAAWLAGYVTPGAAAGLGVREAVLILALSDMIGAADAALLAVSYRGVTLLGDAVFFFISNALTAADRRVAD